MNSMERDALRYALSLEHRLRAAALGLECIARDSSERYARDLAEETLQKMLDIKTVWLKGDA